MSLSQHQLPPIEHNYSTSNSLQTQLIELFISANPFLQVITHQDNIEFYNRHSLVANLYYRHQNIYITFIKGQHFYDPFNHLTFDEQNNSHIMINHIDQIKQKNLRYFISLAA